MGCNCSKNNKKDDYNILDVARDTMKTIVSKVQSKISDTEAKNYVETLDEATQEKRLRVCARCDYKLVTNQCAKCGCFVNLKVKFTKSKCPIGKW